MLASIEQRCAEANMDIACCLHYCHLTIMQHILRVTRRPHFSLLHKQFCVSDPI